MTSFETGLWELLQYDSAADYRRGEWKSMYTVSKENLAQRFVEEKNLQIRRSWRDELWAAHCAKAQGVKEHNALVEAGLRKGEKRQDPVWEEPALPDRPLDGSWKYSPIEIDVEDAHVEKLLAVK